MCHGPFLADELRLLGVVDERLFQFNLAYGELLQDGGSAGSFALPNTPSDSFVVLCVGRIIRGKGVFDLYDAVRPLLGLRPELHLVYVGDGRDFTSLAERVEADGLSERVALLGSVEHSRLIGLYRMAQIVVTPTRSSFTESRCKVAIESLVAGRPVIAPNFGPFPYVIKHGQNGLLYEPNDVASLRDKLAALFDDRKLLSNLTDGAKATGGGYVSASNTFAQGLNRAFRAIGQQNPS